MAKTLYAHTAFGPPVYPEYCNFSAAEDGSGDLVVTVRAPHRPPQGESNHARPGHTASMTLPKRELPALIEALTKFNQS
jgi:hypothetical protein